MNPNEIDYELLIGQINIESYVGVRSQVMEIFHFSHGPDEVNQIIGVLCELSFMIKMKCAADDGDINAEKYCFGKGYD